MGLLDDQLQIDAQNAFGDTDGLAESVTYTPYNGANQAGTPITAGMMVERLPTEPSPENARLRIKPVQVLIPRDANNLVAPNQVNVGDKLLLPWRIGDVASNFTITERLKQDTGGFYVRAESST